MCAISEGSSVRVNVLQGVTAAVVTNHQLPGAFLEASQPSKSNSQQWDPGTVTLACNTATLAAGQLFAFAVCPSHLYTATTAGHSICEALLQLAISVARNCNFEPCSMKHSPALLLLA